MLASAAARHSYSLSSVIPFLTLACLSVFTIGLPVVNGQSERWVEVKPAVAPKARYTSAMVYDGAREQVLLFGGNAAGLLGDTWVLKGNVWKQLFPKISPQARWGHAMVYDQARKEVVLFSGYRTWVANDLWVWDGSTWTWRNTPVAPQVRFGHAMAYDASRKRTVLFGGYHAWPETWEWDGKVWVVNKKAKTPPVRSYHAMAYDAARKEVVLFGGSGAGLLTSTWTWDGVKWTNRTPVISPGARINHRMVYDHRRQVVVMFGGESRLADTWTWDGKLWTKMASKPAPPGRSGHAMAYDGSSQETVLFGGLTGPSASGPGSDTWRLTTYAAAASVAYGVGCGKAPGLLLGPSVGSLPVLGEKFALEIRGLPATTSTGILSLGVSMTAFGPVKLPLDLGPFGMKGCNLYNSFDIQFAFTTSQGLGRFALPIPYSVAIKGSRAYLQAFGADPAATKLGIVSSNGLGITLGYR